VEQHLLGHPAEVTNAALDPCKQALLALVAEGPGVEPLRIAERRGKEKTLTLSSPIGARRSANWTYIARKSPGGSSWKPPLRSAA
jgi:hypothetical protein